MVLGGNNGGVGWPPRARARERVTTMFLGGNNGDGLQVEEWEERDGRRSWRNVTPDWREKRDGNDGGRS